MKCLGNKFRIFAMALLLMSAAVAQAQVEPTPYGSPQRGLRSDYINTWYLYNDSTTGLYEGVLDPDDEILTNNTGDVVAMDNWWTNNATNNQYMTFDPGTAAYENDIPTWPHSVASQTDPNDNFWLGSDNLEANRITFYMNYAQWDNNVTSFFTGADNPMDPSLGEYYADYNGNSNGFSLGWVTNTYDPSAAATVAGSVEMDIYVHDGRYSGFSPLKYDGDPQSIVNSNPSVMMADTDSSRALRDLLLDPYDGIYRTLVFNESTGTYDQNSNQALIDWFASNGKTLTAADIAAVVAVMEVQERDAFGAWLTNNAIHTDLTPDEIYAATGYLYSDAITDRSTYYENSTDGGVIGGLAGFCSSEATEWTEQTVVRIDVSQETLATIDELVFLDFGYDAASGQINPVEILLNVADVGGFKQLYFERDGLAGLTAGDFIFDDNRIYIGQMEHMEIPEPGTFALLGLGGMGFLSRRKKNRSKKNK